MPKTITRRYSFRDDFDGKHYYEVSVELETPEQERTINRYLNTLTLSAASKLVDADPPVEVAGCKVTAKLV